VAFYDFERTAEGEKSLAEF